ncbi:MAG: EI24 domain-containing protein [Bacteroidales bacterium]
MSFSSQIEIGLRCYAQAFRLLFTSKLFIFLLSPIFIAIVLFTVGFYFSSYFTGIIYSQINDYFQNIDVPSYISSILNVVLHGIVFILIRLFFFLIFVYFGSFVILMVLSPVFSILSEKVEEMVLNTFYPFDILKLLKDIGRSLILVTRNFIYQLLWFIIIWLITLFLSFIPLINIIAGFMGQIILFLIVSYFYGFSFMDYSNERRGISIQQSVKIMRSYRWLVITIGAVFCICLYIPYIGTFLASFMAIVSVVAATLGYIEIHKKTNDT